MISCTVEDPDGGGCGGSGGGGYNNGTGKNEVASGSLWWNIPSSFDITKLEITSIAYDPAENIGGDAIRIVVKDNDGDWWKVVVAFEQVHDDRSIDTITATSKAVPGVKSIYDFDPNLNIDLPSSYPIDLLSTSNYDPTDACYQYANIDDRNTLVTYLDSGSASKHTALIFYELNIDDV